MDIREIRIGDIVTTNGKPMGTKEGDYYQVIEIDSKNKLDDFVGSVTIESVSDKSFGQVCVWVDYLEPIPLTDKLLERLGFEPIFNGNYHKHIDNFDLLLIDLVTSYEIVIEDYDLGRMMGNKSIKYLHQLQHELYDTGVEFKIEL